MIFKAGQEGLVFLDQPHIWQNFRKGMTLLDLSNPDTNEHQLTIVARKGLNKIYSMNMDILDVKSKSHTVKNLLLAGAKKSLLRGHKVEVVK